MRVINYSAAARYIQDDVEIIAGNNVDSNTIVTAIMRLGRETQNAVGRDIGKPFRGCRLSLQTGVSEITINTPQREQSQIITRVLELLDKGYQLYLHQFPEHLKIITLTDSLTEVTDSLRDIEGEVDGGFALLSLKTGSGARRYDLVALITDMLFRNGVHLVNAFFTEEEITLVINEDDASKAFDVLRIQIARSNS